MKYLLFCIALFAFASDSFAKGFIDTVYSFTPGIGQNVGQSPEYFPMNIFGAPASSATVSVPASAPEDILSLGIGGEIIVGIRSGKIYDGEGVDFIIFENAFKRDFDGVIFAEPAIVSVSQDGVNFIKFPYNEWTLSGLAGKTPTIGSEDPFNYPACGGDGFDISELGLDYITHIKIKDVSKIVCINETHPYYQPEFMVTGFDLDAISIRYTDKPTSVANDIKSQVAFSETGDSFTFASPYKFSVGAYSLNGNLEKHIECNEIAEISKSELPSGLIIFIIEGNGKKEIVKAINAR